MHVQLKVNYKSQIDEDWQQTHIWYLAWNKVINPDVWSTDFNSSSCFQWCKWSKSLRRIKSVILAAGAYPGFCTML